MEQALSELAAVCQQFDRDILYDAHGLATRLNRSEAVKMLLSCGRAALPAIVQHLREHQGLDQADLELAWCVFLNDLRIVIGDEGPSPRDYSDPAAWITWAERNA